MALLVPPAAALIAVLDEVSAAILGDAVAENEKISRSVAIGCIDGFGDIHYYAITYGTLKDITHRFIEAMARTAKAGIQIGIHKQAFLLFQPSQSTTRSRPFSFAL
jgi:hypothetical protein